MSETKKGEQTQEYKIIHGKVLLGSKASLAALNVVLLEVGLVGSDRDVEERVAHANDGTSIAA